MSMRVGFIGLGNMGGPMAAFVRGARYSLAIHDLRREVAAPLLERGAVWADSPREMAAQCDVVCICVPGPAEMQSVMLGAGGGLEGVQPGVVVIDHTTNAPAGVRPVGAAGHARGGQLLRPPLHGRGAG